MGIVYHPKVSSDLSAIMQYYEEAATPALADEFYREFKLAVKKAAQQPESFRIRARDIRRAGRRRKSAANEN
jgi:plasmid stabilization system protein ParE